MNFLYKLSRNTEALYLIAIWLFVVFGVVDVLRLNFIGVCYDALCILVFLRWRNQDRRRNLL